MEPTFALRWNDFYQTLSSGFRSLMLSEAFCDVILAVEGKLVRSHKLVLAVVSPFFKAIFEAHDQSNCVVVVLKDVTLKQLNYILTFVYEGEVNIEQSEMPGFLKTAEVLQIKGLSENTSGYNVNVRGEDNLSSCSQPSACNMEPSVCQDSRFQRWEMEGTKPAEKRLRTNSELVPYQLPNFASDEPVIPVMDCIPKEEPSEIITVDDHGVSLGNNLAPQPSCSQPLSSLQPRGFGPQRSGGGGKPNLQVKCRGQMQLLHDSYPFQVDRRAGLRIFWRCPRYRAGCRARCVTVRDTVLRLTQPSHNHPPPQQSPSMYQHQGKVTSR